MWTLRVGTIVQGHKPNVHTPAPPTSFCEKRVVSVFLSRRVFRWFWLTIMLTHVICAVFPAAIGVLYRYLLTTNFMNTITSNALSVDKRYYPSIAAMYFGFAAIHCGMLGIYLVRSVWHRKFTLRLHAAGYASVLPEDSKGNNRLVQLMISTLNLERLVDQASQALAQVLERVQGWLPHLIQRFASSVFDAGKACVDALDIRSENYGLFFLLREIIQTFVQTYQAYRVSTFVPRLWMNNVLVGFLVPNCWSTPLIQFFLHSSAVGRTRLYCAVVSVLLDVMSYMAIPFALFMPYYQQFDRTLTTYGVEYGYMDVWLIQMINELQLLLVASLYDCLSRCLIALSVARWLYAITKIVCPLESLVPTRASILPEPFSATSPKETAATSALSSSPSKTNRATSGFFLQASFRKQQLEKAGNRFLMLWEIFVLCAHLHAASHPMYPQCRLRTRPWFTSKPGCSLLEINCRVEKFAGAASDIKRILSRVEAEHLEHLVIQHCPSLEVPAQVNQLNHLLGLKVYNSAIAQWNEDAAITNSSHPMLRFIFLIDMNATVFPRGLLSPNFPSRLSQVVISRSNLMEIPDNLDTIWPKHLILVLEDMQLSAFPVAVPRMMPLYLSLALNNLTEVPEALFLASFIPLLILNGNPIKALPATPCSIGWLSLVSTSLEVLPSWLTKSYLAMAYVGAANTPLCERLIAKGEATAAILPGPMVGFDCSLKLVGPGPVNWYPIAYEEIRNPSYTLS